MSTVTLAAWVNPGPLFVCLFYCFIASRYSSNKVHTQTHRHTDTHQNHIHFCLFIYLFYCFIAAHVVLCAVQHAPPCSCSPSGVQTAVVLPLTSAQLVAMLESAVNAGVAPLPLGDYLAAVRSWPAVDALVRTPLTLRLFVDALKVGRSDINKKRVTG